MLKQNIGRAQRSIGRAQMNIGRAWALPGLYKTTPLPTRVKGKNNGYIYRFTGNLPRGMRLTLPWATHYTYDFPARHRVFLAMHLHVIHTVTFPFPVTRSNHSIAKHSGRALPEPSPFSSPRPGTPRVLVHHGYRPGSSCLPLSISRTGMIS